MTHPYFLFNAVYHHKPLSKFGSVTFNLSNKTGASSSWLKTLPEAGHGTFLSSHLCFLEEREEKTQDCEQHNHLIKYYWNIISREMNVVVKCHQPFLITGSKYWNNKKVLREQPPPKTSTSPHPCLRLKWRSLHFLYEPRSPPASSQLPVVAHQGLLGSDIRP